MINRIIYRFTHAQHDITENKIRCLDIFQDALNKTFNIL